MSEMREGTPEWALAYMEDAARHTLLDEGSGTKELRKAVKIIATAIAEAEARGRRQGLEEAAKAAEFHAGVADVALKYPLEPADADRIHGVTVAALLQHIRYLATAPAETQKPETRETNA